MNTGVKRRFGDQLIDAGLISRDQLKIALYEQGRQNKPLGETLVSLGFLSEETLRQALSENLDTDTISLQSIIADPQALAFIPKEVARRHQIFPVSFDAETGDLVIATADPTNVIAIDQVQALLGERATPVWRLAAPSEIPNAIETYYGHELSIDGILHEIENGTQDSNSLSADQAREFSHPVVRLIDALLTDAVLSAASDIHFEPEAHFLRIRYRIDGVLRQIRSLHNRYWPAMLVRLKIIARMNIAENRAPQDGRISLVLSGREVDFRASAHPTVHGENFVLRILDRKHGIVPLEQLDLHQEQRSLLKIMLARPEGILLVTGPTGSGKTTTLYSILNHRNQESVNIMTLEDPVEYHLPLIRQTSIAHAVKLNFAEGVRSLMRQDPDIILVGEIRDSETAEMAFRAAMTGHQVFSTLHANSALRSIPRLLDLGIEPEVLSGNMIGIIAQRLVRRLCMKCRRREPAIDVEARILHLDPGTPVFHAAGCKQCGFTGYRGRFALMEIVRFDDEMNDLIARRATLRELEQAAFGQGFRPLAIDGIRRVCEGDTTLDEVSRVVDITGMALA